MILSNLSSEGTVTIAVIFEAKQIFCFFQPENIRADRE
jgi:hypothetical protein